MIKKLASLGGSFSSSEGGSSKGILKRLSSWGSFGSRSSLSEPSEKETDPAPAPPVVDEAQTTDPNAPEPWALTIENYRKPESIYNQLLPRDGLEHPPVKLLKWGWMEKRADRLRSATTDEERRALALPRRQDLERDEPDAFYSADEVRKLETNDQGEDGIQLSVVSVSHAWETLPHPDPRGENLLRLADAIKRAQTTKEKVASSSGDDKEAMLLPSSVAVFFDYCSLFQKDPKLFEGEDGGDKFWKSRTDTEMTAFNAALSNMDVWYAHAGTTVILLTETPAGSSGLPYDARADGRRLSGASRCSSSPALVGGCGRRSST